MKMFEANVMTNKKYYEYLATEQNTGPFSTEDYAFFSKHNLSLYFCERVYSSGQIDNDQNKSILLVCKLNYKKFISEICSIGKSFEENNIHYLVMKGINIAETYPEPYTRQMGDYDILIKPHDINEAKEVLIRLGYSADQKISTYKDISLFKDGSLTIELHHALLHSGREPYAEAFTDDLWKNPMKFELFCGSIFVPRPEMHFRYIVLHTMKHLKGGGIGLKSLLDLKYFSQFYKIDLEDQLVFFKKIGYGDFYRAIVSLCYYKLSMNIDTIDWLYKRESIVVDLLGEFISEAGAFGHGSEKHRINDIYEKYNNFETSNSKVKILINALFPRRKNIVEQYSYLDEQPWLLPLAWIHRFIRITFDKNISRKEKFFFYTRNEEFMKDKNYMMNVLGLRKDI